MTNPPMDAAWSPELWMTVTDVFHIRGRGTVIVGRLEGGRQLNVGDFAVCDGTRFVVNGIEQFGATLTTAEPGLNIGVLLRNGPPGDMLRNRTVQFESKANGGMDPQFTVLGPKKKRWRR